MSQKEGVATNFQIQNISCGYGDKTVIGGISFHFNSGDLLCLLGPNGVGKTTFFKTVLGFLRPQKGEILLDGQTIEQWSHKKFAMQVAYVPQAHVAPFPFDVIDVVMMGRTAHLGALSCPGDNDRKIAEEALATLAISHLKNQPYTEISGGERQLVLIARALTQKPKFLIMDEPTANLDFGNQIKVINHIKRLVQQQNMGVMMTTHFPNQAFYCATKVVVMGKKNKISVGTPNEVITEKYLKEVYGVDVKFVYSEEGGCQTKFCIPVDHSGQWDVEKTIG
ncbi:iron complex transport system ATP-binding protein [Sporomusaceae bacterium BoRhaA]|uniref:ABC transporter ATP-binding protein n=1 Tax=Pelorhabdus rhamnosifermentans TaxID=2772457 RepID=UPI001C06267E|nr:ABC transporter ATP-binding protein [Pelorhabdus rhamnosifermentans]MBU2703476.1 iron complex transport system ATP-binding protein [Pelorhabdus rhamnosifermentans]